MFFAAPPFVDRIIVDPFFLNNSFRSFPTNIPLKKNAILEKVRKQKRKKEKRIVVEIKLWTVVQWRLMETKLLPQPGTPRGEHLEASPAFTLQSQLPYSVHCSEISPPLQPPTPSWAELFILPPVYPACLAAPQESQREHKVMGN